MAAELRRLDVVGVVKREGIPEALHPQVLIQPRSHLQWLSWTFAYQCIVPTARNSFQENESITCQMGADGELAPTITS
jgi:hypothetical protein